MYEKNSYKKTIRFNGQIKSIVDKNFNEVRRRTGLKLSYGKIARAFWSSLAGSPKIREQCMDLVCKSLINDAREKARIHGKRKS